MNLKVELKRTALAVLTLVAAMNASAQADDPIIMHINGVPVTRSEFEYSFNKNNADGVLDKKDVKDYVQLFVDFKLKVQAAKDAGIDTLTSIRKELYGYREQMVLPELVDSAFIEDEARRTYDQTAKRFEGQDLLTASHILVRMSPDATAEEQARAKARIDSIYQAIQAGADFAELARNCSEDPGSAPRGGMLNQFGKGMMIPDFENAAYALQKDQMSAPVKSTVGWHIIKLHDRHPFEPYEYHHDNIIRFLEQRGIREVSANMLVDSLAKQEGVSREVIVDRFYAQITAKDNDLKYLGQEYYDGTLMYELSKTKIWDVAAKDEAGLAAYFKANKKKYAWDEPRFKGLVLHAANADVLARAKKLAKGADEAEMARAIVAGLNNDSVKVVRVEHGIFKKGDSKAVDMLVFKASVDYKPMKDYPETDVVGRVLKQPQIYTDVRGLLTSDYQSMKEKEWVEDLRRKYPVSVDQQVLETVNRH